MARSKSSRSRGGTQAQKRARAQTRAAITQARKAGILKTGSTKPGKRPGGSIYAALARIRKATGGQPYSAPKATAATRTKFAGQFLTRRGRLIVPKPLGTTRTRATKKGEIIRTRKIGENKITERVIPRRFKGGGGGAGGLPELKPGQAYKVTVGTSAFSQYFTSGAAMAAYLATYEDDAEDFSEIDIIDFPDEDALFDFDEDQDEDDE